MRKPRLWRGVQNLLHEKQRRLVIGGGIGCFLLLSLLAMAGERGFFEVYKYSRHLERVESRIRTLEEENKRLRMQAAGLRSDPYQVEKLAREDLGLARPDEVIFEIVDGHPQDASWPRGQRKE
jgi:cell division protein FtsB